MPRSFEVSAPAESMDRIISRIRDLPGVVGLTRQRDASIRPRGDVLSIHMTNDATRAVLTAIEEMDLGSAGSVVTSEPRSIIAPDHRQTLAEESNETTWDEMAYLLRQDTNISANYLSLMTLAGAIAAVGMWADSLHIVIAAMVIAPAFEPLVRLPFGIIAGPGDITSRGLLSMAAGYIVLAMGGLVAVLALGVVEPRGGPVLNELPWVRFWSTVTPTGVLASTFAAAAGAVVVSGQRSVLTTGVMIALALIPSMAIVGMALGHGDLPLAARGLVRWSIDVLLVVGLSALVLLAKKVGQHRERAAS